MTKVLLITQDKGGVGKSLPLAIGRGGTWRTRDRVDASPRLLELGKRAKFFKIAQPRRH